jgi:pimeloyl-ACP methyl ester carboxylesterase
MPEALAAMQSDADVQVAQGTWLAFRPEGHPVEAGLLLYPGARVDYRAYAPLARAIADQGYLVVIVRMPLNLAVLSPDRAQNVFGEFPEVRSWAIGGHSLGGAMAARFAYRYPDLVEGLVLYAAYPAEDNSLAERTLAVASIYGTRDGLATTERVEASRVLLPKDTVWVAIAGGNHAQFGWYGQQSGDNSASISREAQQEQTVEATVALLRRLR